MKNTGILRIQAFRVPVSPAPIEGVSRHRVRRTALPLQLHHRRDRQRRRPLH